MANTIIRAKNFRMWFKANFTKSEIRDIANHGADAGWHDLTATSDCVHIFDRFASEIWGMAVEEAEDFGHKNVAEMIAGFARSDMLDDWDAFRNLMVYYAAEKIAGELTNE